MKYIYTYDIWDGDKGIIIAKDFKEARQIFKNDYPNTPITDLDTDNYDSDICRIDKFCTFDECIKILPLF